MQPVFDALWGGDARHVRRRGSGSSGPARLNPFAAMAAAGVPLAFGSDAPVTPLGPWEAVRAAAHHRTPEHALTVEDAFAAHTVGGWRAAGVDDAGTLVAGAPAHLRRLGHRARVADGLPDLTPGCPDPTCLRTVVARPHRLTREGALT